MLWMPGDGEAYLRVLKGAFDELMHVLEHAFYARQVAVAHMPGLCTSNVLCHWSSYQCTRPRGHGLHASSAAYRALMIIPPDHTA